MSGKGKEKVSGLDGVVRDPHPSPADEPAHGGLGAGPPKGPGVSHSGKRPQGADTPGDCIFLFILLVF